MCKTTSNRRRRSPKKSTNVIDATTRFFVNNRSAVGNGAVGDGDEEPARHTWWRHYPAWAIAPFADAIAADLDSLTATDPELRNALRGEVTSALRLAIEQQGECAPFYPMTDLMMTTLVRCALEGSAAAAMVMGQVIKSCGFEHDHGHVLVASWAAFKSPKRKVDSKYVNQISETVIDAFWIDDPQIMEREGWS